MRGARFIGLAGLLLTLGCTAAAAADCDARERDVEAAAVLAGMAADMDGALHGLNGKARAAFAACPDSEALAYLAARTAELGYNDGPRTDGPSPDARKLAADGVGHHPESLRLMALQGRLDGTVETAQRAYDREHGYVPARVALALALSRTGKPDEALRLLEPGRDTTAGEHIARARVLLAAGRAADAAREAEQAGHAGAPEPEIVSAKDLERDTREVWGLALVAAGRKREALPHLRTAAALGSAAAEAALNGLKESGGNRSSR